MHLNLTDLLFRADGNQEQDQIVLRNCIGLKWLSSVKKETDSTKQK